MYESKIDNYLVQCERGKKETAPATVTLNQVKMTLLAEDGTE